MYHQSWRKIFIHWVVKDTTQPTADHTVVGTELVHITLIILHYFHVYLGPMPNQTHPITEVPLVLHIGCWWIIQIGNVDDILQIILERTLLQIFHLLDINNLHWLDVVVICVSQLNLATGVQDLVAWYPKDLCESLCFHLLV